MPVPIVRKGFPSGPGAVMLGLRLCRRLFFHITNIANHLHAVKIGIRQLLLSKPGIKIQGGEGEQQTGFLGQARMGCRQCPCRGSQAVLVEIDG